MSMTNLPFLKPHGWPQLRKYAGESKYGFSEDDEIIEHALDELIQAIQGKDSKLLVSSLRALIDCIMARQGKGQDHAADSL